MESRSNISHLVKLFSEPEFRRSFCSEESRDPVETRHSAATIPLFIAVGFLLFWGHLRNRRSINQATTRESNFGIDCQPPSFKARAPYDKHFPFWKNSFCKMDEVSSFGIPCMDSRKDSCNPVPRPVPMKLNYSRSGT